MKVFPVNNTVFKTNPVVKNTSHTIVSMSKEQAISSRKSYKGFFSSLIAKIKKLFTQKTLINSQSENKVFELEEISHNDILVDEFFKAYPDLDLNAKDKNGLTLLLRAVDRGDERFIYDLVRIGSRYKKEIDWNIADNNGNNAAMRNINNKGSNGLQAPLFRRVDINYINPKTKRNLFQEAIVKNHEGYIQRFLNFYENDYNPGSPINYINQTHPDTPPVFFLALSHNISSYYIEKMLTKCNVDLDAQYKGKTVFEYVNINKCKNINHTSMEILQTHLLKKDLKKMKEYYDKEGFVDLDQILDYVKLPRFSKICNEPLNSIDENIGHFVAEIVPKNFDEIKKISEIIDLLYEADYNFNGVDGINRTAITKAIEVNNLVVFKLLYRRNNSYGIAAKYRDELKKNNITDQEWYMTINH